MSPRLLATLMLSLGLVLPVRAALFEDEEARRALIDQRQTIKQLQEQVQRLDDENAQIKRAYLDLQAQNENLSKQLAVLRGSQEELAKQISDVQRGYKDLAKEIEDRFGGIESRLQKLEPVKVTVDGLEFVAEPAEKRDYEAALDLFRKGEFAQAAAAYQVFVNQYPRSGYLPTALFWAGNSLYAIRKYKDSIAEFNRVVTQFSTHPRASEAMLSIANCQIELKDLRTAKKTIDALIKQYPGSDAAIAGKERLSKLR